MVELKEFQKQGVLAIRKWRGRALLADEQGLGKTIQALYWIHKTPGRRPAVIICPASMKYTWQAEAALHFNMKADVLEGRKPKKAGIVRSEVLILNYEIAQAWADALISLDPQVIILDEVHYIKNPEAQRCEAVMKICEDVPSVIGLSGTPMTNRPIELWPTLKVIKPNLFPDFHKFAWNYCKPRYTVRGWVFDGATRKKDLRKLLVDNVMIRRLKRDVLKDLPPKTRKVVPFKLDSYKEYRDAQTNFLEWLGKRSLAAAGRAKKSQTLVKVGYLLRLVAELKLKWVERWIDDFLANGEEKLVAFTNHTKTIEAIEKKFAKICVKVDGSVTGQDRTLAVRAFQVNPKVRLFVGNIRAAGVGLTLHAARQCVFMDLPWTPGDLLQSEDRVHRIGQEGKVIIHYLITMHTIEEKLCKIIQSKASILDAILNGERSHGDLDIFKELIATMDL